MSEITKERLEGMLAPLVNPIMHVPEGTKVSVPAGELRQIITLALQALDTPTQEPVAAWRHKCAGSGFHDHDGCSCSDAELRARYTHPSSPVSAEVTITDEMVERAARAMEPMAFREEFTVTDEWYELEVEGRHQALGRARAALLAALNGKE